MLGCLLHCIKHVRIAMINKWIKNILKSLNLVIYLIGFYHAPVITLCHPWGRNSVWEPLHQWISQCKHILTDTDTKNANIDENIGQLMNWSIKCSSHSYLASNWIMLLSRHHFYFAAMLNVLSTLYWDESLVLCSLLICQLLVELSASRSDCPIIGITQSIAHAEKNWCIV